MTTVSTVKILDMKSVLPMIDAIVVELIPSRNGSKLGAWNLCQRMEKEAKKRKAENVSRSQENEGDEEGGGGHGIKVETQSRFINRILLLPFSLLIPRTRN